MATPQPGIFALGTRAHHHLQFDWTGAPERLVDAIRGVRHDAGSVVGVNVVVGVGPRLIASLEAPSNQTELTPFEPIVGPDRFTMPAAQHDLWVWIHGATQDGVLDVARDVVNRLADLAAMRHEQQSFVYRSSQDLTGFEDGTENPPLDEAIEAATVPQDQPGAAGSIALVQRWVHDLASFEQLDVGGKERVFGRTLVDSIELDASVRSPGSHVSRVVIEDDAGEELEVFRRSTAFGGVAENGLMFVAFSADQDRLDHMLRRMAGVEDAVRDHLTEYSTPTAGAWYFVPPIEAFRAD